MRPTCLSFAFVVLALAPSAQRRVLVVDKNNGPGTDYTTIQAAINAAGEFDLLLVRSGTYVESLTVTRSLTLAAHDGADVVIEGMTLVQGIPLNGAVAFRSLVWDVFTFPVEPVVRCESSAGSVLFEECSILSDCSLRGVHINDTRAVLFRDCVLEGGCGVNDLNWCAARVGGDSAVGFVRCLVAGKDGGGFVGPDGTTGLLVVSGDVLAVDTILRGGHGESCGGNECHNGDGAAGARVGTEGRLYLKASTIEGGFPGNGPFCGIGAPCLGGSSDGDLVGQAVTLSNEAVRRFVAKDTLCPGEPNPLTFFGEPGDVVVYTVSLDLLPVLRLPFEGIGFTVPASVQLVLGAIPAGLGSLSVPSPLGHDAVPLPFFEAAVVYHQAVLFSRGGGAYYTDGRMQILNCGEPSGPRPVR